MGLDVFELVMEVEATFQIHLDDAQLGRMQTVGDLYSLVLDAEERRLRKLQTNSGCVSSAMFYRVRRGLMAVADARRTAVRLDTSLDNLLPAPDRRGVWRRLGETIDLQLPPLKRPLWLDQGFGILEVTAFCGMVLSCLFGLAASAAGLGFSWLPLATCFAAFILLLVCDRQAQRAFGTHIPSHCTSVRGLVLALLPPTQPTEPGAPRPERIAEGEVWRRLQDVISESLGVNAAQVTPDARWAEDLGCD